jgi:hypothetical protein
MNFKTIVTVLGKVPWPAWALAGGVAAIFSVTAWYDHKLEDAEARGVASARVAIVRDSTHRVIAARDTAAARQRAAALKTTGALSASVTTLKRDNAALTAQLKVFTKDTTADTVVLVDSATVAAMPDSAFVLVHLGLVRAADRLSQDAFGLYLRFIEDSTAHVIYAYQMDTLVTSLKDALNKTEQQVPAEPPRPSFIKRAWHTTEKVLEVVGVVTVAVIGYHQVKK